MDAAPNKRAWSDASAPPRNRAVHRGSSAVLAPEDPSFARRLAAARARLVVRAPAAARRERTRHAQVHAQAPAWGDRRAGRRSPSRGRAPLHHRQPAPLRAHRHAASTQRRTADQIATPRRHRKNVLGRPATAEAGILADPWIEEAEGRP